MPRVNENTEVALPLRNIISMLAAVAVATWAYFTLTSEIHGIKTSITMMQADLEQNTEFRIKWPRGEMGSLPADSEQFMLIEHLADQLDELSTQIDEGRAPHDQQQKLTLEFYEKRSSAIEARLEIMRNGDGG